MYDIFLFLYLIYLPWLGAIYIALDTQVESFSNSENLLQRYKISQLHKNIINKKCKIMNNLRIFNNLPHYE